MTEFPQHPFWDFSLEVYMAPGVGEACLGLQERHGLDVNFLLFCVWTGASGRGVLDERGMEAATSSARLWHDAVVRPLRAVRTRMKGGLPPAPAELAESLRRRIQEIEIDCEHAEQLMLAGSVGLVPDESRPEDGRAEDAAANVARYFGSFGGEVGDEDRSCLEMVLGAAFAGVPPVRIGQLCGSVQGGGASGRRATVLKRGGPGAI